jgi:hypothetical protein
MGQPENAPLLVIVPNEVKIRRFRTDRAEGDHLSSEHETENPLMFCAASEINSIRNARKWRNWQTR